MMSLHLIFLHCVSLTVVDASTLFSIAVRTPLRNLPHMALPRMNLKTSICMPDPFLFWMDEQIRTMWSDDVCTVYVFPFCICDLSGPPMLHYEEVRVVHIRESSHL